jgi:hypothetical protein
MKKIVLAALLIISITSGLRAQSAPDAAELTRLVKEFLEGASRNDAAVHDRFWADDLIYTGSSGRRIGKADIMRDQRSPRAPGSEGSSPLLFCGGYSNSAVREHCCCCVPPCCCD